MTTTDTFIDGLKVAEQLTGVSKRQACIKAGINETTLRRFMKKEHGIRLDTLSAICNVGYGMSLSKVIALGNGK